MSKQLINKLKEIFESEINNLGYELVDIEFVAEHGERFLRFFIHKDGGIEVDDCEKVSVFLDPKLDELDLIPSSYYLEVSSPDLSRPLKNDNDLRRNIGVLLDVSLYRKVNNKKTLRGILVEFNEDSLVLDVDKNIVKIDRKEVSKIEVAIVF